MTEQQLSVRSTKARQLAHRLAQKERRTISQVVERALESYASNTAFQSSESADSFWNRIANESRNEGGPDFDIDALLSEHRTPHKPIEF